MYARRSKDLVTSYNMCIIGADDDDPYNDYSDVGDDPYIQFPYFNYNIFTAYLKRI